MGGLPKYAPEPNPETKKKDVVWFALDDNRPLFSFAGIWTTFNALFFEQRVREDLWLSATCAVVGNGEQSVLWR
jgi:putative SOS response-associated peptidase YedK